MTRTPLVLGLAAVAATLALVVGPRPGAPVATPLSAVVPSAARPETPALRAARVLDQWQAARSRAYAEGDVAALRRLHVAGSPAGRRDVAVLRAYAARGVGLDLTTRTTRVAVLVARPRLVVARAWSVVRAVAHHHGEERVLPAGAGGWRRLELRLAEGRWRLSAATPEPAGSRRAPP